QLDAVEDALEAGARQVEGFTAHLSFPVNVQALRTRVRARSIARATERPSRPSMSTSYAPMLADEGFVIWLGFGARHAAAEVRALAERSGARVLCSPRAKGIFPESHPQFVGVTGVGGHDAVAEELARDRPARTLVLGTRLGEATSLWSPAYLPRKCFVHVDVDESVFGAAYPRATTMGIEEDVRSFVGELAATWPARRRATSPAARPSPEPIAPRGGDAVRPRLLLGVVQR